MYKWQVMEFTCRLNPGVVLLSKCVIHCKTLGGLTWRHMLHNMCSATIFGRKKITLRRTAMLYATEVCHAKRFLDVAMATHVACVIQHVSLCNPTYRLIFYHFRLQKWDSKLSSLF